MNDKPQDASAVRITRLLGELTRPTAFVKPLKGATKSPKLSVSSVGASLFLITLAGLLWIKLGPLVESPDRTMLTSDVRVSPRVADATDPSLPAAASALRGDINDADTASAPTF